MNSPPSTTPPNKPPSESQTAPGSANVNSGSALDSLKGPAPSLEAYANYQAIAPPTVLRSERQQAGKKEYLTGCAKLKEILEHALGLSKSIPVPPATIILGLREMQEAC
ncbi:uncharacterized protein VP01_12784g1 [Puccinia sorghi]|uniref:Uncharacterized protein n=1 Tax=Puccinia sorghi TaxID=27349 RepID=A0A0L6VQ95_9BASI|nr:uncharacterized protein VP01_12784g1 [Puccinia sorghi]